jgi:hypothetical protein
LGRGWVGGVGRPCRRAASRRRARAGPALRFPRVFEDAREAGGGKGGKGGNLHARADDLMVHGAEARGEAGPEHSALAGAHDGGRLAAAAVGEGQARAVEGEAAGAGAGAQGDEAADLARGGGVGDEHAVLDGLDLLGDDALDGEGVGEPPVGGGDEARGAGVVFGGHGEHPRGALRRCGRKHDGGVGRAARRRGFRGRAVGGARNGEHGRREVEILTTPSGRRRAVRMGAGYFGDPMVGREAMGACGSRRPFAVKATVPRGRIVTVPIGRGRKGSLE